MAATVKRSGNLAVLLPRDCSVEEVSAELMQALGHAFRILHWQENLRSKDMPPEWMWPHDSELKEWFDEVDIARENEFNQDDPEATDLTKNELAERFRK